MTLGTAIVAKDELSGVVLGFINLIAPGTQAYPSPNLRWLEAWGSDHVYVDRIAVRPEARGRRLGEWLYAHAMGLYAGEVSSITCEVNLVPANPGSLRFHTRVGFEEIGRTQWRADYAVAFLARRI